MALSELYNLSPYRRYVFWPLAIFPSLLVLIVGGAFYYLLSRQQFSDTQIELKTIATRTANFIPVEVHERLRTPDDMRSEDYRVLELYLQSVMAGNDQIDDIYTLRPTEIENIMLFVVSAAGSEDRNGDNLIDEGEEKALLGEPYDISIAPAIYDALTAPSADSEITYDKWGSFLSGYAPLRNDTGEAVGILGVDYRAETISATRHRLLWRIVLGVAIVIPIIFALSWFLARRVTKPLKILIHGLDRIRHGEYSYEIPAEGKSEEQVVSRLLNAAKEILMAAGVARQQSQLEKGRSDIGKDKTPPTLGGQ